MRKANVERRVLRSIVCLAFMVAMIARACVMSDNPGVPLADLLARYPWVLHVPYVIATGRRCSISGSAMMGR